MTFNSNASTMYLSIELEKSITIDCPALKIKLKTFLPLLKCPKLLLIADCKYDSNLDTLCTHIAE